MRKIYRHGYIVIACLRVIRNVRNRSAGGLAGEAFEAQAEQQAGRVQVGRGKGGADSESGNAGTDEIEYSALLRGAQAGVLTQRVNFGAALGQDATPGETGIGVGAGVKVVGLQAYPLRMLAQSVGDSACRRGVVKPDVVTCQRKPERQAV